MYERKKSVSTIRGEYEVQDPKAVDCLTKDETVLFTFYAFHALAEHIRTTNPIESIFATVPHRTRQTKECGRRLLTLMMFLKLAKETENRWCRLRRYQFTPIVIQGKTFTEGPLQEEA